MLALLALSLAVIAPAQDADALARRERSNLQLKAEGVPINAGLPVIESEAEARRPTAEAVAVRALALLAVSMKGGGMPEAEWRGFISRYQLAAEFSPEEARFLADPTPSEADRVAFSWRHEAACALLWAVGKVEALGRPAQECGAEPVRTILKQDRASFLAGAKLRPVPEVLDQADLIYRYRWALVDQQVGGKPVPAWLSDDIAMERHHAFNWLVQNPGDPWDDISLET
jgi:hypothetical protein